MAKCVQSRNRVCKHIEASDVFYVDLGPILEASETVSSITSVTPADSNLTASSAAVLTSETIVKDEYGATLTIEANTGVSFNLAGGTTGDGGTVITVVFVKSTGKTDAIDCIVDVEGTDV